MRNITWRQWAWGVAAVIGIVMLMDLFIRTDEEALYAEINSFCLACSTGDAEQALRYVDDEGQFSYSTYFLIDTARFRNVLAKIVEAQPAVEIKEYQCKIDKDAVQGHVVFTANGKEIIAMTGSLGRGADAVCEFTWARRKDGWKITSIQVTKFGNNTPKIPLLEDR